jgi:hypothetical protein
MQEKYLKQQEVPQVPHPMTKLRRSDSPPTRSNPRSDLPREPPLSCVGGIEDNFLRSAS